MKNDLFLKYPMPSALPDDALDIDESILFYLIQNFHGPLNLTIPTNDNIHHFFDAVIAFSQVYANLDLPELVDGANYILDTLVQFIDNDDLESKFAYRKYNYHTPDSTLFLHDIAKLTGKKISNELSLKVQNTVFGNMLINDKSENKKLDIFKDKNLKTENNNENCDKFGENSAFKYVHKDILKLLNKTRKNDE